MNAHTLTTLLVGLIGAEVVYRALVRPRVRAHLGIEAH
jgi:hypothetical protein